MNPRLHLRKLPRGVHGGLDYGELRALGIRPEDVLDFSVNTNPALPPPVPNVDISTYPDNESHALREAAAERYGVRPEQVIAGNGSSELIWLICLAFLEPGDKVRIRRPTFGEYERAARIHGATVVEQGPATMDFVCNPNNPTGRYAPITLDNGETLLVVDEAYADFVQGRPTLISNDMPENLIVLRSLTKFSALAGLRLGLAFAQPETMRALWTVKPPWNVNAFAQAAGEHALRHPELLPDLGAIDEAKRLLFAGFEACGFQPLPSDCNFFLVRVGDGAALRRKLLAKGILVRDCASFGLPDCIRVSARRLPDCERLLEVLGD